MNKLNRSIISTLLIGTLLFQPVGLAIAQEAPPAPVVTAPSAPTAAVSTPPSAPSDTPPAAPNDTPPVAGDTSVQNTPEPTPDTQEHHRNRDHSSTTQDEGSSGATSQSQPSTTETPTQNETGAAQADLTSSTGDGVSTGSIINEGNMNIAAVADGLTTEAPAEGSISLTNVGNGSDSVNNSSALVSTDNTTSQNNSAAVTNTLDNNSVTGGNTVSKNTGTDATVSTGDANVSGTIINNVNSNIAGVMVSEFNVNDNQQGDLILDFAANCISGCATGTGSIQNKGNGADSNNTSVLNVDSNNATFQTNDANLDNNLTLVADSGHNTASKNTGGDSSITTGDANVSANVINNVNNNVEGAIVYGVVNIYGDLHGDIILPEEVLGTCCGAQGGTAANTGNGADSTNNATLANNSNSTTEQTNVAMLQNNLVLDATTGDNTTDKNTNGDSSVQTGSSNVNAQVVNVANSNIAGGTWWLVLVNEAGKWIGHIVGGEGNGTMAGSTGTEFSVDQNGAVTISNANNGAGSENTAEVNGTQNTSVVQTNTAVVNNNVNLVANTGKNSSNKNTGGDSSVTTGDANIMANIVNFVNNNITGGGKLFVTVVNVFGSWAGNFITPGSHKEETASSQDQVAGIGGAEMALLPTTAATQPTPTPSQNVTTSSTDDNEIGLGTTRTIRIRSTLALANTTAHGSVLGEDTTENNEEFLTVPDDAASVARNGKTTINLAWLILSLPFGILAWISKRFEILAHLRSFLPHG